MIPWRFSTRLLCIGALCLFSSSLLVTPAAIADILELNDGNLIECKLLRKEKDSRRGEMVVILDEEGKEKKYRMSQVKSLIRTKKTSWEVAKERRVWYSKESTKVKDTWKSHERFAKKCYKKRLRDESTEHYLKAYEIRKADTADDEASIMKLADWLEDKCELFQEAQVERRRVYAIRKAALEDTFQAHMDLAKWSSRYELLEEAAEQYRAALDIDPTHKRAIEKFDLVKRQLQIPMDSGFYRAARVRVAAAARYLRGRQNSDGSFGSDIIEAGVHGLRAMTALSCMALLAEWDFGVLSGKYDTESPPEEVVEALDYLETFEPTVHANLSMGDDIWGPIFALDLYVQCYRRPQFEDRKSRLETMIEETIEELKGRQRNDGGWFYYNFVPYSGSFVTASAIMSFVHAENQGFKIDRGMISRGVTQIQKLRQGHGTFTYSPGLPQGPVGACARSPLCELALTVCGATKETSLRYAIDIFFKNRPILEKLKGAAGTHIGEGKTAPYYLLFAHYWTARAIKHLPYKQQRKYLNGLGGGLVAYQEGDATFGDWTGTKDFKVYGTALASLTLYYIAAMKAMVTPLGDPPPEDEEEDAEESDDDGKKPDEPKPDEPKTDPTPDEPVAEGDKPDEKKPDGKPEADEKKKPEEKDKKADPPGGKKKPPKRYSR